MWSEGRHGDPVKFKFVKRLGMLCLHMLFSAPLLLWLKEPPSSTHRSREPSFLAGESESETMSDGYMAMYLSAAITIEETMQKFQEAWPSSTWEWREKIRSSGSRRALSGKTNGRDVLFFGHLLVCIPKGFVTVPVAEVIK